VLAEILAVCSDALARARAPLIIEGVGGVMSPVAEDATCLDWISALGAPTLLVTGTYLGAISHALTAASVLDARGVTVLAVIANETSDSTVPLAETCAEMERFLPGIPVLACPRGAGPDHPAFAELTRLSGF
jgi:dethiobiotin synthetase